MPIPEWSDWLSELEIVNGWSENSVSDKIRMGNWVSGKWSGLLSDWKIERFLVETWVSFNKPNNLISEQSRGDNSCLCTYSRHELCPLLIIYINYCKLYNVDYIGELEDGKLKNGRINNEKKRNLENGKVKIGRCKYFNM